jgi:hypothetical protein
MSALTAPPHLKLAQYFYKLRMEELKSEIEEQETQFRYVDIPSSPYS